MHAILRRFVEWKGRRQGAHIVIFDGASEIEKTRSFLKGTLAGVGIAILAFAVTAPTTLDPVLVEEIARREALVRESNARTEQALQVAEVCLTTAQSLDRTLAAYQAFLGGGSILR
ncbi:MAG TPA: hypothetical protein VMN39_06965 [Longimicrobiaceae bacterium]|nr:hypothetical protein [Longimicrobiaceae bacterium]